MALYIYATNTNVEKGQYIENWVCDSTNWTGSMVSFQDYNFTMAKSAETMSTKPSLISSKAASLKKTVKKSAKAIGRPFKKIKQSLANHSTTHLIASHSSTALATSDHEADHEADGVNDRSITGDGSAHSSDKAEVELMPKQQLGA